MPRFTRFGIQPAELTRPLSRVPDAAINRRRHIVGARPGGSGNACNVPSTVSSETGGCVGRGTTESAAGGVGTPAIVGIGDGGNDVAVRTGIGVTVSEGVTAGKGVTVVASLGVVVGSRDFVGAVMEEDSAAAAATGEFGAGAGSSAHAASSNEPMLKPRNNSESVRTARIVPTLVLASSSPRPGA